MITITELNQIIQAAGGQCHALGYAQTLLEKLTLLHSSDQYSALFKQFKAAKNEGDLRGRVLEVNFASGFIKNKILLEYGAKQGGSGDIDFCWNVKDDQIFIEMKLLGQDEKTKQNEAKQLALMGYFKSTTEDTLDIGRIQRDIIGKSSTKKFNPQLSNKNIVNIVAIDVSELQLGMIDLQDCLLAVGGNCLVSHQLFKRPQVVGVFENLGNPTNEQIDWMSRYHLTNGSDPHPRTYVHAVLFLFREPAELAALSYELSAELVWNSELIRFSKAKAISDSFHKIIPRVERS